jgi:hypothetical protein
MAAFMLEPAMSATAISVDHDGQTFTGQYEARGKTLHVTSAFGSKVTQIGGMDQTRLAQLMLLELVREYRRFQI